LPSPSALGAEFVRLLKTGYQGVPLTTHIGFSLFRTLTGFFAGVIQGVPLGLLTGYSRPIGAMFSPRDGICSPNSTYRLYSDGGPLLRARGLGKVVLIFFTAFNYVHVNAHSGAANILIAYRRAAHSLGLTQWQTFFRVILPGSIPQIFTGLKVAMALSWAVVVAAELTGAQAGLGYMISDAALLFRIPVVFIGIALIGIIGLILNLMLNYLEHKIVHWKGR
jgi:NitT/TauT family transport system permease protein